MSIAIKTEDRNKADIWRMPGGSRGGSSLCSALKKIPAQIVKIKLLIRPT
jgi:hypothetical protein